MPQPNGLVGFCGPAYRSQSPNVDAEKLINFYLEQTESPYGKAQYAMYPTPGFAVAYLLPQSPIRGMLTQNGRTFAVGGTGLYELNSNGTSTLRSTTAMLQDMNPATLSTNGPAGHQVFTTSGGHGYIYDLNSNAWTADVVIGATFGGFLDGYFLALDAPTSTLKTSDLEDGTSWSGSAQRNTAGDNWQAMLVTHRNIWLFGSQRTDVWYNAGAANFPFAPIDGAFIEQGIMAPFACGVIDNAPYWWGATEHGFGMLWRANGFQPERLSNHAIEFAVQGYADATDAVSWPYQDQGHTFFVTNFPTGGTSWVSDAALPELWHERATWNPNTASYSAYRPQYHVYAFGQHLVGDRSSGAIYEMAISNTTEVDGGAIRRQRRTPYVVVDQNRVFFDQLQLDLEVGLGTQTITAPQVMLRWSNDQAKTWSNEHWASAGPIGAYGTRVQFQRLGQGRNRIFEVTMTDSIPWRVTSAILTATPGIN